LAAAGGDGRDVAQSVAHSGDAGHRDILAIFHFADRLRDTIRRRGENISSMEVEDHRPAPDIAECAVYPVRSEHREDG
jgi:crotonobetaine/carnitine-CoA ligase